MATSRKNGFPLEISNISSDGATVFVDREEIMKLTKMAKSWEFTCSFCFKQFQSAQAMGGHQNAHRHERLEEKRLYVRDPISYRKRAFLQAMKADQMAAAAADPGLDLHGPPQKMVKSEVLLQVGFGEFNDVAVHESKAKSTKELKIGVSSSSSSPPSSSSYGPRTGVMNFLPPKELCLAESVGQVHAAGEDDDDDDDDAKDKACIGINLDQKLDLTLKL